MYGIWNDWKKEFQFGIREPTKAKASKKLFKRIGKDAYKWRFEIREIKNTSKNVKGVKTMKKFDGYEKAEAFTGEYEKMEPGGYVCRILQVKAEESDGTKNYDTLLRIGFDVAEGDKAGIYKRMFDRKKAANADAKWPGMYYQTIKADDLRYFKGFITAIEESNPGYKWDWDEQKLKGKLFGGVFGEEEYKGNDGKVHTSIKLQWVRSADKVRNGDYTVPEKKLLKNGNGGSTANVLVDDGGTDDLPF